MTIVGNEFFNGSFKDLISPCGRQKNYDDLTVRPEILWTNRVLALGLQNRKRKLHKRTQLRIISSFLIVVLGLMISGCSKGYPELGCGYKIVGEGGYTTSLVDSQNTQMISEYILDYSMDSTFIIVAQSPPDSLPKMNVFYYSDNNRKEIASDGKVFRQYWIINKKAESIYSYDIINRIAKYSNIFGPYTKEEYLMKKDSLNVSKDLKLELE